MVVESSGAGKTEPLGHAAGISQWSAERLFHWSAANRPLPENVVCKPPYGRYTHTHVSLATSWRWSSVYQSLTTQLDHIQNSQQVHVYSAHLLVTYTLHSFLSWHHVHDIMSWWNKFSEVWLGIVFPFLVLPIYIIHILYIHCTCTCVYTSCTTPIRVLSITVIFAIHIDRWVSLRPTT